MNSAMIFVENKYRNEKAWTAKRLRKTRIRIIIVETLQYNYFCHIFQNGRNLGSIIKYCSSKTWILAVSVWAAIQKGRDPIPESPLSPCHL